MTQSTNITATQTTPPTVGGGTRKYIKPRIEIIFLDNEIALALESTPPVAPGEEVYNAPAYFNTMPFYT